MNSRAPVRKPIVASEYMSCSTKSILALRSRLLGDVLLVCNEQFCAVAARTFVSASRQQYLFRHRIRPYGLSQWARARSGERLSPPPSMLRSCAHSLGACYPQGGGGRPHGWMTRDLVTLPFFTGSSRKDHPARPLLPKRTWRRIVVGPLSTLRSASRRKHGAQRARGITYAPLLCIGQLPWCSAGSTPSTSSRFCSSSFLRSRRR
jgi:hypothetical protein